MEQLLKYVDENFKKSLDELMDYLRIPSVSSQSEHKEDMYKAANFLIGKMNEIGITKTKLIETKGHPLVYGEWLAAKDKPTVLIYGHYDVQPADPIELWKTPPFEPVIKGGKIWGRGANDDKGQSYTHLKSLEAYMKVNGSLPCNVKFLFEGEEEIGGPALSEFLKKKESKNLLKCDAVLISDTNLYEEGVPTITYGLRGLCYMEIELTGPNRDLHSGSFGGAVGNPINELAKMISKLHDKNGKIAIPGFYDDAVVPTKMERDNFKRMNFNDEAYAKMIKVKELQGEKGWSTLERLWVRPSLDCNGIFGGYTGEGAKTVLPSKATAKISMRLVPGQDYKKVVKLFTEYVKAICPSSMQIKVKDLHGGQPAMVPLDNKAIVAASQAMSKVFGKETVYAREGASIPVVVEFLHELKAPAVLMGFGLESDDIHSPNEHFKVKNFEQGIKCSLHFFDIFSKM